MDCRVKPGNDENKYTWSFRDGPQDQARNLEVIEKDASQSRDSGFALTRAPE
jgi:hypothetical protein